MTNKIFTKRLIEETSAQPAHWIQKRAVAITVTLLGLVLILVVMTMSIMKYETHLTNGDTVLLELAPVDPRGFMQGDYMALSYALESDVFAALRAKKLQDDLENLESLQPDFQPYQSSQGYVIVKLDSNNVGHFMRLANSTSDTANNNRNDINNLAANERAIYYRVRNGSVQLATNAFFFQEGHAKSFEAAKYGLFRINDKGEPLLSEMVDDSFQIIKGKAESPEDSSP